MYIKEDHPNFIFPENYVQTFKNNFQRLMGENDVIIKMKNSGVITNRDLVIAKLLYEFKFATPKQVCRYLGVGKVQNITARMNKLVDYRVLNKFFLRDPLFKEGKNNIPEDAFFVYCLDLGGRTLLTHYSQVDTTDWLTTTNMVSANHVSKYLLITDFYIELMNTCPERIEYFILEPERRVGKKSVFPHFEFKMNINGQAKYFIGEIFRKVDYPTKIMERAAKYESFLATNAWKKYYYDSDSPAALLIFADDDELALHVGRIFSQQTELTTFRLSTDERLTRPLYEAGTFVKYVPEEDCLKNIKASAFAPKQNVQ